MAELQKDPITRADFLGFGVLSAIVGAVLTIPPAAYLLGPIINVDILGRSDVPDGPDDWHEVGSISQVKESEPKLFEVKFPIDQIYAGADFGGGQDIQKTQPGSERNTQQFGVRAAVYVTWKHEINSDGTYGKSLRPSFLDEEGGASNLSQEQMQEVQDNLNVLSNSCAHLGCPVRWVTREGEGEFLCPCHGGIYNINGFYVAGPPPRGLYSFTHEVREDGNIYIKHEFDVGHGLNEQEPFVI